MSGRRPDPPGGPEGDVPEGPPGEPSGGSPAPPSDAAPDDRPEQGTKDRRLTRHLRHARTIWQDPRSTADVLRAMLLELWRARGGGFYGLGYMITFVLMEVRLIRDEWVESASLMAFLTEQIVEFVLRVGFMSLLNLLLAFLWPLFVLEHVGGWGIPLLVIGYFAFERWLRPVVEGSFPELRRRGR